MLSTFYRSPVDPMILMCRLFVALDFSELTDKHCRMFFEISPNQTVLSFYKAAPEKAPSHLLKCLKKNGIVGVIEEKTIGERVHTRICIPMDESGLTLAIDRIVSEHSKHKSSCSIM